jgi:hypothetical protein
MVCMCIFFPHPTFISLIITLLCLFKLLHLSLMILRIVFAVLLCGFAKCVPNHFCLGPATELCQYRQSYCLCLSITECKCIHGTDICDTLRQWEWVAHDGCLSSSMQVNLTVALHCPHPFHSFIHFFILHFSIYRYNLRIWE